MKILVINCGSSSFKFQLFDMDAAQVLAKGMVERIGGQETGSYKYECRGKRLTGELGVRDHEAALAHLVGLLTDPVHGAIASTAEIEAVGHRVVHGGEAFIEAVLIDEKVLTAVREQIPLAPLHNPANLAGIHAAQQLFPQVMHVAVFDTAFHQTMPPRAYLYGLPYELYEKHRIRRYGFHGISHRYVARRGAEMLGKPLEEFSGITCHLGNGSSLAAIRHGQSIDTSMGLTPLEGLIMGTRCGDIDPAIPFFLTREAGFEFEEVNALLNRKSGLLGISGLSNDVRTLVEAADDGDPRAVLALEMFAYRVKQYIGAYMAVLNGCDAIIFTGGVGENATTVREQICAGLNALGIRMSLERNNAVHAEEAVISTALSDVALLVVPTNEEWEIARETACLNEAAPTGAHRMTEAR
jgi:acetate kinase